MTMPCGNTQAEKDRDTQTYAQEQAQYAVEQLKWKIVYNSLIQGCEVRENGHVYSLADRMADQYQEFSDMVDSGISFMDLFLRGEFCDGVNNLFKGEARTLASIIVG